MENEVEMKKEKKKRVGKVLTLPLLYVEALILMLLGELLGMSIRLLPHFFPSLSNSDVFTTLSDYGEFWGMWALVIIFLSIRPVCRPILKAVGRKGKGNTPLFFLLGILTGFLMNALCVLIAYLRGDISLVFSSFDILPFLLLFLAVFIQSGAEELVCRVFLYQRLRREYKSPLVAVIGNSIFFASLHILNDGAGAAGILNTFVIALLLSFVIYYSGSFWCTAALHTAWNFTQNILFGLPNSGSMEPYSVFRLSGTARDSFAYSVSFGIEGGLLSSFVIALVTVLLILYVRRHKVNEVNIWDDSELARCMSD